MKLSELLDKITLTFIGGGHMNLSDYLPYITNGNDEINFDGNQDNESTLYFNGHKMYFARYFNNAYTLIDFDNLTERDPYYYICFDSQLTELNEEENVPDKIYVKVNSYEVNNYKIDYTYEIEYNTFDMARANQIEIDNKTYYHYTVPVL